MAKESADAKIVKKFCTRFVSASSVLIIVGTKGDNLIKAYSIAKSLNRLKKVKVFRDEEIDRLSDKEYEEIVDTTDLIVLLNLKSLSPRTKFLALDARNTGAYMIAVTDAIYKFCEHCDYIIVTRLPGVLRTAVRILLERGK